MRMINIGQLLEFQYILSLDNKKYKTIDRDWNYVLFNKDYLNEIQNLEDTFYHNFDLLNFFIDFIYNKLKEDDWRKHILYFLKWALELQITIFSSLSHSNYLAMFSLIRVHIENLFHILWLCYNWKEIIFEKQIDKDNFFDSFLYNYPNKNEWRKSIKFKYSDFLKVLLDENSNKDELQKNLFWFDFLSKYVHWSWLYSVWQHIKYTWEVSDQNYNKFYSEKWVSYILFIQWTSLYIIKEIFQPSKELFWEDENYILNLDATISFLEKTIFDLEKNDKFKNLIPFWDSIKYFKNFLDNENIKNKLILKIKI